MTFDTAGSLRQFSQSGALFDDVVVVAAAAAAAADDDDVIDAADTAPLVVVVVVVAVVAVVAVAEAIDVTLVEFVVGIETRRCGDALNSLSPNGDMRWFNGLELVDADVDSAASELRRPGTVVVEFARRSDPGGAPVSTQQVVHARRSQRRKH